MTRVPCTLLLFLAVAAAPAADWKSEAVPKHTVGANDVISTDGKVRAVFVHDKEHPPMLTSVAGALVVGTDKKMLYTLNSTTGPIRVGAFDNAPVALFSPESETGGDHLMAVIGVIPSQQPGPGQPGIFIVNLKQGKALRRLDTLKQALEGLVFSPDGKTLFAVNANGDLTAWEVASGKPLQQLKLPLRKKKDPNQIHFEPVYLVRAGERLVVGRDRELHGAGLDLKKWEVDCKLTDEVDGLQASADGSNLAVRLRKDTGRLDPRFQDAIYEYSLAVYKPAKLEQAHTLEVPGKKRIDFQFVPGNNDGLASTRRDSDGTVIVWDVKTGKQQATFKHPRGNKTPEDAWFRMDPTLGGKIKTWWQDSFPGPPGYAAIQPVSAALMWTPPAQE